ncbi:hypothetical protein CAAN3_25S00188 [[Candida] anglica]
MSSFQPYGQSNTRIVSDLSRFEYDAVIPRNRSRNATPTSIDEHHMSDNSSMDSILKPARKPTMIEVAERNLSNPKQRDVTNDDKSDFFSYYMKEEDTLNEEDPEFVPYPESFNNEKSHDDAYRSKDHRIPEPVPVAVPQLPRTRTVKPEPEVTLPYNSAVPPTLIIPQPPPKDAKHLKNSSNRNTRYSAPNPPIIYDDQLPPAAIQNDMNMDNLAPSGQHIPSGPVMGGPVIGGPIMVDGGGLASGVAGPLRGGGPPNDVQSIISRKKYLEEHLIKSVMNRPLIVLPTRRFVGFNDYQETELVISFHFVVYVFEIFFAIIVITLAGVLLSNDGMGKTGIYRYFIADGVISLFVSLLFVFSVINFEKRNGNFYCLLATILNIVSFIMVTSTIIPNKSCSKPSICNMRRALTAFIILSMFIWFTNLIMFITTKYISTLNLLDELNFDYSGKGSAPQYNANINKANDTMANSMLPPQPLPSSQMVDPYTGQPIKEYILNERGELYPINDQMEVRGREKILVYTF